MASTGLVTVGGLATGLDTNQIISQLVAAASAPVTLLQQQLAGVQATQSSIGTLAGDLSTLGAAAQTLGTASGVLVQTATSSDQTVVTAAAGTGAQNGALTLNVTQLAHGSTATSSIGLAASSNTVATGPGTFQFQVGSGPVQSVAVDGTTTLDQLVTAINGLGAGVTASAVNLGTTASPDYRLVVSSTATGASSTITIVHDDTSLLVQTTQAGQNAQFTVSGLGGTFQRESNTFGDVIPNVTLSLRSTGTATVTVSNDVATITNNVQALVNAFNAIVSFVNQQSTVSETQSQTSSTSQPNSQPQTSLQIGSLALDTTTQNFVARLHAVLSGAVAGSGSFVNLSGLGVATQQDGTVTFDATKFQQALATDPASVAAVLAGPDGVSGIASQLAAFVTQATGPGGFVSQENDTLNSQVQALQDQIATRQDAVNAYQAQLQQAFNNLETTVSTLQSQQNALASLIKATIG
ncbi:MAG TPA: flagellar filament capping protein FliD [Candidatus Binatia bacterium]|nr:flagellar filament capping protein FliD [Candidatus Binatia bacterium]